MVQKKNSKVLKKIPKEDEVHANCLEKKCIDYDAQLLDIEGDPLEEFEEEKTDTENKVVLTIHFFKCLKVETDLKNGGFFKNISHKEHVLKLM